MIARTQKTHADKAVVRRDGDAVIIDIPMSFRRRSGRKEVVLPPGAVAASAVPATSPRTAPVVSEGRADSAATLAAA